MKFFLSILCYLRLRNMGIHSVFGNGNNLTLQITFPGEESVSRRDTSVSMFGPCQYFCPLNDRTCLVFLGNKYLYRCMFPDY